MIIYNDSVPRPNPPDAGPNVRHHMDSRSQLVVIQPEIEPGSVMTLLSLLRHSGEHQRTFVNFTDKKLFIRNEIQSKSSVSVPLSHRDHYYLSHYGICDSICRAIEMYNVTISWLLYRQTSSNCAKLTTFRAKNGIYDFIWLWVCRKTTEISKSSMYPFKHEPTITGLKHGTVELTSGG